MKIVHVNFKFLDEGGRSEYIFQLAKGLSQKGHFVYIVSSDELTGIPLNKNRLKNLKNVKFIGLPAVPTSVPSRRFFIPDLAKTLLKLKVDIIHAHGISDLTTQMAILSARVKNVPLVVSTYFHPCWAYREKQDYLIWKATHEVFGKTACIESKRIICASKEEKSDIQKTFNALLNGKLAVIEPGVDFSQFENFTLEDSLIKKFNLPGNRRFILILADLKNPRKGLYEAIKIVNEVRKVIPSLYLLACGSWPEYNFSYKTKQVLPLIKRLGMNSNMSILGPVTISEKAGLFKMAEVFLSPTTYESFGIALAEALYNKVPVVTTKIGGTQTIINDKKDGFLVNGNDNINDFTQRVIFLLQNKEKALKMGELGHKKICRNFGWEKAVRKTEKLYEKLLD